MALTTSLPTPPLMAPPLLTPVNLAPIPFSTPPSPSTAGEIKLHYPPLGNRTERIPAPLHHVVPPQTPLRNSATHTLALKAPIHVLIVVVGVRFQEVIIGFVVLGLRLPPSLHPGIGRKTGSSIIMIDPTLLMVVDTVVYQSLILTLSKPPELARGLQQQPCLRMAR